MAVRAPPTWRKPVGDGANRSFIGRGVYTIAAMRDQRGFTLVEILVAFLILTIVITTSLVAFIERNRRLQQASEIILAYQSLANETEYRRRVDYANLDNDTEFLSDTTLLAPLKPFTTSVIVKQTQPGVKNVLMAIRWRDGQRVAQLELVRVDTGGSNLW
jgi:prepilin-type N-terminal cleavage/methylation domain-containing protein